MRKLMVSTLLMLLLVPSLSFGTPPPVTAVYLPVDGGFRYYLTVYNYLTPAEGNIVAIEAYTVIDASGQEAPPLWDANIITDWEVFWGTNLVGGAEWEDGITPGTSLSGFSFKVPITYSQFTWRLGWHNGSYGTTAWGDISPTFVPEPSSLLALGGGLAAVGLLRRRVNGESCGCGCAARIGDR